MKSKRRTSDSQVLKPVKQYRTPIYPEREVFLDNPSSLSEYVPSSWKILKIPAAALLFFVLNTCANQGTQGMDENSTRIVDQNEKKDSSEQITQQKALIAPIFIHGDGIGTSGCIAISPPVFLSETDALELIRSKLEKEKLIFDKRDYIIDDIYSIDELELSSHLMNDEYVTPKSMRHPFYFDFYSTRYNLGIKFISGRVNYNLAEIRSESQDKIEARILADKHTGMTMNKSCLGGFYVAHYDLIETAQRSREFLRKYAHINTAFFYDPLVKPKNPNRVLSKFIDTSLLEPKKNPEELLEKQVDDFIAWFNIEFNDRKKR